MFTFTWFLSILPTIAAFESVERNISLRTLICRCNNKEIYEFTRGWEVVHESSDERGITTWKVGKRAANEIPAHAVVAGAHDTARLLSDGSDASHWAAPRVGRRRRSPKRHEARPNCDEMIKLDPDRKASASSFSKWAKRILWIYD